MWSDDLEDDDYRDQEPPFETFTTGRRRPRWLLWLAGVVTVFLLIGVVGLLWARSQINPGHPGAPVAVSIPAHSSTATIGSILGKAGVIHSPSVFRYYTKIMGTGVLLPGDYHLAKNSSYSAVISALHKGPPVVLQRFTIPEGFTLSQIAARVGALPGRSAARFEAAATSGQIRSQFQPSGVGLEGLLFPATYQVRSDEDEASILRRMVSTFDENATNAGITQAAATLGITPYQVIVVASIIEREAKLDEDRGPIASVIYNRIKKNMMLQIDATVLYGQGLTDPKQIDTKSNTPYNTYRVHGVPPTPIASPGMPSLQAAANPPTTTYIYYVLIDRNGKQAFASNAKDFAKLAAESKAKGLF